VTYSILGGMVASAYVFLGLLVGMLSGLSSSPIASALLAALFAFAGGTAAHLIEKKPGERRLIGLILACFSCACLIGLLGGIAIKDNRLLSFTAEAKLKESEYFKSVILPAANAIHVKYVNKDIDGDEAYQRLRQELQKQQ
jgi:hypothetical protein